MLQQKQKQDPCDQLVVTLKADILKTRQHHGKVGVLKP